MTKLEICAIEDANPGQINLFPEGTFYKAYQQSAWLLCTRVHPFKVSVRPLKGLDGPLLSVGFPKSSFEKFSSGLVVGDDFSGGGKTLKLSELIDTSDYSDWAAGFVVESCACRKEPSFNSLPVYGSAYRLAVEITEMASRLERNYRYSLGEDLRMGAKKTLLQIVLASKGGDVEECVGAARLAMLDVQLSLRLLNDLKAIPDKRYVYFLEITEDIVKQLSNWERSLSRQTSAAGVPSPP